MVNKMETHKLLAIEMDYLRHVAKISQMYRVKNGKVVIKTGMKIDILQETEEQRLRSYGCIMRMEDCRIAIQVVEWKPQRKMRCSRPINTWQDGIRVSMQRNLKDEECFNQELWKQVIMSFE
jgi:hypothetical protein